MSKSRMSVPLQGTPAATENSGALGHIRRSFGDVEEKIQSAKKKKFFKEQGVNLKNIGHSGVPLFRRDKAKKEGNVTLKSTENLSSSTISLGKGGPSESVAPSLVAPALPRAVQKPSANQKKQQGSSKAPSATPKTKQSKHPFLEVKKPSGPSNKSTLNSQLKQATKKKNEDLAKFKNLYAQFMENNRD